MRTLLCLFLITLSSISVHGQNWNWVQGHDIGPTLNGHNMAVDHLGNIYCTGAYDDTTIFAGDTLGYTNNSEIFVAKFDSLGNPIWARGYPGFGNSEGRSIAVDEFGNSYAVGYTTISNLQVGGITLQDDGPIIVKHDSNGNVIWAQALGITSSSRAQDIFYAGDESLYLTGWSNGSQFDSIFFTSSGSADAFLAKMDTAGQFAWVRNVVGGAFNQSGLAVKSDILGNAYVTGEAFVEIGFEDDTILIQGGGSRTFIVKYDSSGNYLWGHGASGSSPSDGYDVAPDPFGNVYATGLLEDSMLIAGDTIIAPFGSDDIYLLKFDPDGALLWHHVAGGPAGGGAPNALQCDQSGNVYLAGGTDGGLPKTFDTISYMNSDHIVVKYTALANAVWIQGSIASTRQFSDIHVTNNSLFLGGSYSSFLYFDTSTQSLPNYGNTSLVLAEISLPCPLIQPNFTINCLSDSTVELTADAGYDSYKWNDGQFGQSIEVMTTGTYYLVVSDSNNCTGTAAPQSVEVSPPVNVIASGPLELCTGGSVGLKVDTTYASYQWSTGSIADSIAVTSSGSVTVTVTDGLGCVKVSEAVVINVYDPQPSILTSGSTDLCEGESVTLSTSLPYDSYTWTGGSAADNLTVSQAGSYNVTVSEGPGCTATATAVVVTVTSDEITIAADGPLEFCEGEDVTLGTSAATISSYLWSSGATSPSITVTQSATVSLLVTFTNACTAASNALNVIVHPLPSAPQITLSGINTLLVPAGFATYQWLLDGNIINGATSTSYTAAQSGDYTVMVTDANDCMAESEALAFAVGILEAEMGLFRVYPNPSDGLFTIQMSDPSFQHDALTMEVFDAVGRLLNAPVTFISEGRWLLNLSDFSDGHYKLSIRSESVNYNETLIKN